MARIRHLAASIAIGVIALPACRALAVNRVWAGTTGNWTVPSNWSPTGVPQNGDDVFLTEVDPFNKTVTYNDGTTPNITNITYDADGQRTAMTDERSACSSG